MSVKEQPSHFGQARIVRDSTSNPNGCLSLGQIRIGQIRLVQSRLIQIMSSVMMGRRIMAHQSGAREARVKYILCLCVLCPLLYAAPCPTAQTKDEAALIQNEQTWARALEEQDI